MIFASRNARVMTLAVLLSASFVNGCSSWQAVSAPMPDALGNDRDAMFQVRLRSGRTIYLRDAHVAGDSVIGTERHTVDQRTDERVVKVAVSDVESLSVSRFDGGKTAVLLLGVVAAVFVIGAMAVSSMDWGGSLGGLTP